MLRYLAFAFTEALSVSLISIPEKKGPRSQLASNKKYKYMSGKYVLFLILLNYLMYLVMKKGTKKRFGQATNSIHTVSK